MLCVMHPHADYMLKHLHIPQSEVDVLTQQLYYQYGTTMAGLAAKGYQLDFDHYHAHVHGTLDYQNLLSAQPATRQTLADMALQKHILTNADAKHTAACLERMGLTDCFQVRGAPQHTPIHTHPSMHAYLSHLVAAKAAHMRPRGTALTPCL